MVRAGTPPSSNTAKEFFLLIYINDTYALCTREDPGSWQVGRTRNIVQAVFLSLRIFKSPEEGFR